MANRNGVHTLAVPVVFNDSHRLLTHHSLPLSFTKSASHPQPPLDVETGREIEAILRCVRFCLSEVAPDNDSCLREVCFMVPPPGKVGLLSENLSQLMEMPLVKHCKLVFNNVFQS